MLGGRLGDKQPSRLLARWRGWGEKEGFVMGLQYDGKLYGRLGKRYFSTGRTANDFDELEEEVARLLLLLWRVQDWDITHGPFDEYSEPMFVEIDEILNGNTQPTGSTVEADLKGGKA